MQQHFCSRLCQLGCHFKQLFTLNEKDTQDWCGDVQQDGLASGNDDKVTFNGWVLASPGVDGGPDINVEVISIILGTKQKKV